MQARIQTMLKLCKMCDFIRWAEKRKQTIAIAEVCLTNYSIFSKTMSMGVAVHHMKLLNIYWQS